MSDSIGGFRYSAIASADLSSSSGLAAVPSATGLAVAGAGVGIVGVFVETTPPANAINKMQNVQVDGIVDAISGAAFTIGDMLITDGAGKFIVAAANTDMVVATALYTASGANITGPIKLL